jgi:hypothetical protein
MHRVSHPWRWFFAVEGFALLAGLASGLLDSQLGPALWTISFVLLMPGHYIAGAPVEHVLWGSEIGLRAIYVAAAISSVVANGILFAIILTLVRKVRKHGAI